MLAGAVIFVAYFWMTGPPIGLLTAVTFLPALGALVILLRCAAATSGAALGGLAGQLATFAVSLPLWAPVRRPAMPTCSSRNSCAGCPGWCRLPRRRRRHHVLPASHVPHAAGARLRLARDRGPDEGVHDRHALLETGMVGVFVSLDSLPVFVFWEAMLDPVYFVIGVWGGANRVYAR